MQNMTPTTQSAGTQTSDKSAVRDAELEKEAIILIDESTTMQQEEKDSWKLLLPQMNNDQITELKRILITEKQKLLEIDEKYKKEVKRLEKDYIQNYLARKSRQKWQEAREKEQSHLEESSEKAEGLLSSL